METIRDLLKSHPFFGGLSEAQLTLLEGCSSNAHFAKDQQILKQGENADYFYVIRKGAVALDIDGAARGSIRIQTIESGDILGWSWLFPPYKWSFSAYAVEDTLATALDGRCLRTKCEQDHELGYALLKRFSNILAKRLEWTRIQLLDIYGPSELKK